MADLKQAMINKDTLLKGTIQLLKAKLEIIEKYNGDHVTDEEFYGAVRSELKQLDQTMHYARQTNKVDMIKEINYKKDYLTSLLPKQLSYDEVFAKVSEMVSLDENFGSNMKRISSELGESASKSDISKAIKFFL